MNQLVSFQYLVHLPIYSYERPYYIFNNVPEGTPSGNLKSVHGPEQLVEDARGSEKDFDLDVQGFIFESRPLPPDIDWNSKEAIEQKYIPSVKAVLRDVLGDVQHCESFDWRIRHAAAAQVLREPDPKTNPDARTTRISPAFNVHVDQTPLGVLDRMRQIYGHEADSLAAMYRVRLINIWRPLVEVVEDLPLALCDARSASLDDLLEVSFVDHGYTRHNFMAKHSPDFRFFYLGKMRREEVCVFKVFDSQDNVAKRVLHGAFESKLASPGSAPRESIEVRLLVLSGG
ncbi:uncharacterized protein BDZ99DRAFT_392331 [Mytilinidion resinicola]|uniref:Uncharacterized protein n=1 Tax=Mytilinidion resinicola TaxID=574789 RepID=A0A6A6YI30_9PEZI|nr:uncharacterized protein BDZ99DRAFT_392331 [Mytilinidion resinicola]KAF2807645.1 hypothetical protein BDZ99DRAFT_392331 [Mytilinidion resinicola]